jgi:hypothetical protein
MSQLDAVLDQVEYASSLLTSPPFSLPQVSLKRSVESERERGEREVIILFISYIQGRSRLGYTWVIQSRTLSNSIKLPSSSILEI